MKRFRRVPWPWNGVALYKTEQRTGMWLKGRVEQDMRVYSRRALRKLQGGASGLYPGRSMFHLGFAFHSRANFFASASWSEVIRAASSSRMMAPDFPPFAAPNLYHM